MSSLKRQLVRNAYKIKMKDNEKLLEIKARDVFFLLFFSSKTLPPRHQDTKVFSFFPLFRSSYFIFIIHHSSFIIHHSIHSHLPRFCSSFFLPSYLLLPKFTANYCLRRPETFSRKGFWTSQSF